MNSTKFIHCLIYAGDVKNSKMTGTLHVSTLSLKDEDKTLPNIST
jgi:hypothetical protein